MKGKILVIEDNKLWQYKLKKYLEADDFFVEVVSDLDTALDKVQHEMFHFITVDMQLHEDTITPEQYESWIILEIINKLQIQNITPVMVITAFGDNYEKLKISKKKDSLFFMSKGKFDRLEFLKIINTQVKRIDLRFKNDHREN